MNLSSLTVADLRELDDLDNVNLIISGFHQARPSKVPSLDMSQVYSDDSQVDMHPIYLPPKTPTQIKEVLSKSYLPARFSKHLEVGISNSQKALMARQARSEKLEIKVRERMEKEKQIQQERSKTIKKITLKKVFHIENLVDSLKEENLTRSQDDVFEMKIKARIRESAKILKKAKILQSVPSKSVVHASITENLRIVEAHLDCCSSDMERAKKVNTSDQFLRTSLHYACALGNDLLANILLKLGADPKICDFKGRSPLHYSVFSDCSQLVPILLRSLSKHPKIIQSMSTIKNTHSVARLIKYKRPGGPSNNYCKPLELSRNCPSTNIDSQDFNEKIEDLLSKMSKSSGKSVKNRVDGKFLDWTDDEGRTALHLAVFFDKPGLVQALLDAGASINVEDVAGRRPLELSRSKFITSLIVFKLKESLALKKGKGLDGLDKRDLKVLSEEDISKCIRKDSHMNYLM
jgi:hypothetical protein